MYKIYKVISKIDLNTVYIGSTKYSLNQRLSEHKSDAKRFRHISGKYKWILENYDYLNIIEINSADDKKSALLMEESEIFKHMEQCYKVLNTECPTTKVDLSNINSPNITYQAQYRKCGKASCSTCNNGQGHGPYWYAYWREEDGKLKSAYVGKHTA